MVNNPTFKDDGKRRVFCAACKRYITESHLGEKEIRKIKCRGCDSVNIVFPPTKDKKDGQKVILFGQNHGLWTADLTEKEVEDSM